MLYFYQRGTAKDIISFNSRTIAGRIEPGFRASVTLEENIGQCFCWTTQDGLSATAITDMEYPEKAAMMLLTKLIMDFREKHKDAIASATKDIQVKFPEMEQMLKAWQNPAEADKLLMVEKELEKVTEIMHKNLKDLLDRGESVD